MSNNATKNGHGIILIVEDDPSIRKLLQTVFTREGHEVIEAADGRQGLAQAREVVPDLIITDVMMPEVDGLEMIQEIRKDEQTREIPVIMLTAKGSTEDIVTGLNLGADDYLSKPFDVPELVARARSKLNRPPVSSQLVPRDLKTGLLNGQAFRKPLEREIERAERSKQPLTLAFLELNELPQLRHRFGLRLEASIGRQIAGLVSADARATDVLATDSEGNYLLLLPETSAETALRRLDALSERINDHVFTVGQERLRLTPVVGYSVLKRGVNADELIGQATVAAEYARARLDLQPERYASSKHKQVPKPATPGRWQQIKERLRLPVQVLLVQVIAIIVPFLIYELLARLGFDITGFMYIVVIIALLVTAYLIWVEGLLALKPSHPPEEPGSPYPSATAIIAAYLPNEAATIVETIEAFLRVDYPAETQIILAYNTPRDMPIEATLRELAKQDPRFVPYRVEGSTSKAQNVNAALAESHGEFIGIFDADHQPAPNSFKRAWRWLSNGFDVVQGHCLIRNGEESWVSRMVAVEFESIYAVSHPGRARLHDFGIFGGSNGYWKADLLRRIRMHGFMLTEDIDSSLRAIESGAKIASDPHLISRELAPTTLKALLNQRLRWAQGWFQVSLKHTPVALQAERLSARQKLGMMHLLTWREIYPLLSVQVFPIILFWLFGSSGERIIDWTIPILVLATLFVLSVGPGQTLFAYLLAAPELKKRPGWFWWYFWVSSFFYTPFKNLIAIVAQIKEIVRERQWKVTPRSTGNKP